MHPSRTTLALLATLPATALAAPIAVNGTTTYAENFNALPTTSVAWTNDATLPGWYAQYNNLAVVTLQAANGTADLSGLLNLGTSGATERALGSKSTSTGGFANVAFAVQFKNTGTMPVALTKLSYTGELWRGNSGAGTIEQFDVFYATSAAPITNIISGGSSAISAPGDGFTAISGAEWFSIPSTGAVALNGNLPANQARVTASPSGITLLPGQHLVVKWTDPNKANSDGFQGIDDLAIEFTELNGLLTPTTSAFTRDPNGTPGDPSDDTFGFTLNVAGSGSAVGSGWTTQDVAPPNAAAAAYGASVAWSGLPATGPQAFTLTDSTDSNFFVALTTQAPRILGHNDLPGAANPLLISDGSPISAWSVDEAAPSLSQNNATQIDHVITSSAIDLSTTGFVRIQADLEAITGTSSGFEALDSFALELIIDGGPPLSILGASDVDRDGRLRGAATAGTELPDATAVNFSQNFLFDSIVPASANTLQIRIIGNSNSTSETFTLRNLSLSEPAPTLFAVPAGPATVNNQGTDYAGDDTFSGPFNLVPVNLGATPGWTSDALPASGLYTDPIPVVFGPFSMEGPNQTIAVADKLNPSATATFSLAVPVPSLTVGPATNIVRHENALPDPSDDTVTFEIPISGANGGPGWATLQASPETGSFGNPTFTVPADSPSPLTLTFSDLSYPGTSQNVVVALPKRYPMGWLYFDGNLTDFFTAAAAPPAAEWVPNEIQRALEMTNANGLTDKVALSDAIDLSARGTVYFQAAFRAREVSVGSNFEVGDRFKAELLIDGGLPSEQVVNLVAPWDVGDGVSSLLPGSGRNGAPDGYLNGYQGGIGTDAITGAVFDTEIANYNANRARDEFNARSEVAPAPTNNLFLLSYTIPPAASRVQLRIAGAGAAGSEFFTLSQVVFSSTPPTADRDGDGVSDLSELASGTLPNDPTSRFALSQLTAGPFGEQTASFPTAANRVYRGYISTDLLKWTRDDSSPLVTGDGTLQYWTFPLPAVPAERLFLRIGVGASEGDFPAVLP